MARDFLAGMFEGLRCTAVLRLPGRLLEPVHGERLADNAVQVEFEGRTLVAAMDKLLTDDDAMRLVMQQGDTSPDAALAPLGDYRPVALSTAGGAQPQFDYAAEVEAARAAYAQPVPARAQSTTDASSSPLRQPGEPLTQVRVLGCKLVREADNDRSLLPLGQNFPGLTFAIAGDLAQPALSVDEVTWEAAITDDGIDLSPAEAWDRRIPFPKVTTDGRTVYFEVDLPLPPAASSGLQSLRGNVQCTIGSGEQEIDLGFPQLEAGAAGAVHDAQLLACSESEGRWSFEIKLQVMRDGCGPCAWSAMARP